MFIPGLQGLAVKGIGALKGALGGVGKKLGLAKLLGKHGGVKGLFKKFGPRLASRILGGGGGGGGQYRGLGASLGGDPF